MKRRTKRCAYRAFSSGDSYAVYVRDKHLVTIAARQPGGRSGAAAARDLVRRLCR